MEKRTVLVVSLLVILAFTFSMNLAPNTVRSEGTQRAFYRRELKSSQQVEGFHIDLLERQVSVEASSSTAFSEDFEGAFPADNWLVGDSDSNNGEDYWDDISYRSHGGSWSAWCADIGDQISTVTKFTEDFEGAFPGSWTVGDSNASSGEDYWDDISYRSHGGSWSAWCADIGTKTKTTTIFYEDFEGVWPGSWIVGDSDPDSGEDYWGNSSIRSHETLGYGEWSGYCADEGSHPAGCGYDNDMDAYMYRSADLSAYSAVDLSYWYWLDCEPNYDKLYVIYYDGSWHYVDDHTGDSGGWQHSTVTIPTSASYVGLHFNSDSSICSYDGAFVDQVQLTGTSEVPNNSVHEYDDDMDAYMYHSVDLSGCVSATLSYWYWVNCKSSSDYLQVIYYDGSWHYVDDHTGDSGGWQHSSVSIPTSATHVGFFFHSEFSPFYENEGAYVDDVSLTAGVDTPNNSLHMYDDYMDAYMVRKYLIDASGWGTATISYWAWYETESEHDFCQVIVTDNGGANWYSIGEQLTGTSGWSYRSLPVPGFYFSSLFGIGFMFHSDSSTHNYEGVYLDDIVLEYGTVKEPDINVVRDLLSDDIFLELGEELCQAITIQSWGSADLEVTSIVCDQSWLSASPPCPPSFTISPGGSQVVTICVDTTGLSVGVYNGNVQIYSNDPDENPVAVAVTLHVSDTTPPPAPVISSSTHPNENEWFSNNDPAFEWTTPSDPSGIEGYSYTLDHSPSTTPDTTLETAGNSVGFSDIADGEWWFHVRSHDLACNWGPASHYRIRIDTTSPSAPLISSTSHPNENLWYNDNDPTFSWTTPSDTSGIAGYSCELDQMPSTLPDETVDTSSNSESYTDVGDGEWYFHVRAKDNAGNWGSAGHYGVKIDTISPTVIANTPTGTHVPISTTIEVTFSESMNKPSAQGAFSISPTVSGSFSWSGNTIIFTPHFNLASETTYSVTVGTGAMDPAGNYLQEPYNWQFTTESPPPIYDVTIKAHCTSEGVDVSVLFAWNGLLYTTPKIFADQTGSHEVAIEEREPNGHLFMKWLKDGADYSTHREITVSSGGTYTAIYKAINLVSFTTCDEEGNVKTTFQRTETVYVCFAATYPDGSSVITGSASINIQLSTDDGVMWTDKTTLTATYDASKGKWFTAVGYKIVKYEPHLSAPISLVRWRVLFPANALDDGSGNKGPFPQVAFNFSVDKADLNVAITDGMIPGQTYQRTLTTATIKFIVTYPDGSHFTASDLGQITVTITDGVSTYTLKLSVLDYDSVTKKWFFSWVIPKDAPLSTGYKFKMVAGDVFDSAIPDPNSGPLVDVSDVNAFSVVKASLTVTIVSQPATSYYRGQNASFDIRVQYPDLSYLTVTDIVATGFIEVRVYYDATLVTTVRIDSSNASACWRDSFNGFTIRWYIPFDAPLTTPTVKYRFTVEQDGIQDTVTPHNTGPITAVSSNTFDVTGVPLWLWLLLLLLWWLL